MNYEKREQIIRIIKDLIDADDNIKCSERTGYWDDSRYLRIRVFDAIDEYYEEELTVRLSDHDQVEGGGYRLHSDVCGTFGERSGESEVSINLHGDRRQAKTVAAQIFKAVNAKKKEVI